ncbi:hypothetical protein DL93DRAFT_2174492 [Clavulina sp. PMI_390]|nr:hypothetical protein DL93DRAFT_2174492 [Clavulina sp. PMI_390]
MPSDQFEPIEPFQLQAKAPLKPFKGCFPPELWVIIVSFVPHRPDLKNCSLTSHLLYHLALPSIWARFTIHLYHRNRKYLTEDLTFIINNPKIARCILDLQILFGDIEIGSEIATTNYSANSLPLNEPPKHTSSIAPSMIQTVFSHLSNVRYLTIAQVDPDRWPPSIYRPSLPGGWEAAYEREEKRVQRVSESLVQSFQGILEQWLLESKLYSLRFENVLFQAPAHFLKAPLSISFLSMSPHVRGVFAEPHTQPLILPALRGLRTSTEWARALLSSTSPTHTLVLFSISSSVGNEAIGRRMREVLSPVRILKVEASLLELTKMATDISSGGPCPNLEVIVLSPRVQGLRERESINEPPITEISHLFSVHASIHTFVLQLAHYPPYFWSESDPSTPGDYADLLASGLEGFEGRFPPPRVILELGTLGMRNFMCWIFTMESQNHWTHQEDIDPIEDVTKREDILYLTRG